MWTNKLGNVAIKNVMDEVLHVHSRVRLVLLGNGDVYLIIVHSSLILLSYNVMYINSYTIDVGQ